MYKKISESQDVKQKNAAQQCFMQAREALKNNELVKAQVLFTKVCYL